MTDKRIYRILIDGKWTLEDLTDFSRIYFQNYSFLYCLDTEAVTIADYRIKYVLETYELRDGLSYVNIYDIFRSNISEGDKPTIKSMHYSSPGWIDLALNPDVALQIAKVIGIYLGSLVTIAATYKKLHNIYIDLNRQRKKYKNDSLKLEKQMVVEANKLNKELAKGLGFESLEDLDKHTKDTEESSKLLLAHYRRLKKIAEFVRKGKVKFPTEMLEEKDS